VERARRNRRKRRRAKILLEIIFLALIISVIVGSVKLVKHFINGEKDNKNVSAAANFEYDPLEEMRKDHNPPPVTKDEVESDSQDGQNVDKAFFKKSLFLGDSITEGIASYEILDDVNVYANKGFTVLKAEKDIQGIVKSKPDNIFILLGVNDILNGISSEKFVSDYGQLIDSIMQKLPDTKIYVQSIFPVTANTEKKKPKLTNSRINEFNEALVTMTKEKGVNYIDVASEFKDGNGYMQQESSADGIHLKAKSYKTWISNVKNQIK
jgi:hypothetical protein